MYKNKYKSEYNNNCLTKEQKDKLKEEYEKFKLETAKEIGLFDKVISSGWKSLTSKESGALGGKIAAKLRKINKNADEKNSAKREKTKK